MTTRREFLATGAALGIGPGMLGAAANAWATPAAGQGATGAAARTPGIARRRRDEVRIGIVGDVFLLSPLEAAADDGARLAAAALAECDLAVGNLENGLSTVGREDLGGMRYGPSLRGHPDLVRELSGYRIGAVSVANNHTGNFGPDALLQTLDVLDAEGIAHAGAGRQPADAYAHARVSAGPLSVGLLSAYSYYYEYEADDVVGPNKPGIAGCRAFDVVLASDARYDYANMSPDTRPSWLVPVDANPPRIVVATLREDLERLAEATRRARSDVDFLIVSFHIHWGRHYRSDLPHQQQALARAMIDAGADLVVGHGPHTIRGVELYRGRAIAHSIGNFLLSPRPPDERAGVQVRGDPNRESVILRVRISGDSTELEFLPIGIGLDGRPRLLADEWGMEILNQLRGLSAALGTAVSIDAGVGRVSVPSGDRTSPTNGAQ